MLGFIFPWLLDGPRSDFFLFPRPFCLSSSSSSFIPLSPPPRFF